MNNAFNEKDIKTTAPIKAPLVLVFSPNGHGKSSFIASVKNPFVIDTEKKFSSKNPAAIYEASTFNEIAGCLDWLYSQEKLKYGAICLDSIDWIEKAIHNKICADYNVKIVNDDHSKSLNFNKGYDLVANIFFSDIYAALDAIRIKHNIPIIIGAQCLPAKQKEADKEDYIMQDLRVQDKLAQKVSDLVEAKIYLQKREHIDQKGKVIPTEERYLITRRAKGINAKNSLDLPEIVEVSYSNGWGDFVKAIGTCPPTN